MANEPEEKQGESEDFDEHFQNKAEAQIDLGGIMSQVRPWIPYLLSVIGVIATGFLTIGEQIGHFIEIYWMGSNTAKTQGQAPLSPEAQLNVQLNRVPLKFGQVSEADVRGIKELMRGFRQILAADRMFFDLVDPNLEEAIVIAEVAAPEITPLAGFFQRATLRRGELFKVKTSLITGRPHLLFREEDAARSFSELIRRNHPDFKITEPVFSDRNVRQIYPQENWKRLVYTADTETTILDFSHVGSDPAMREAMRTEATLFNLYIGIFEERRLSGILVANLTDRSRITPGEISSLPSTISAMEEMGEDLLTLVQ